jgi:hypothetical protein
MRIVYVLAPLALFIVASCSTAERNPDAGKDKLDQRRSDIGSVFSGQLSVGGDDSPSGNQQGIGVNAYLWRASIDTISFFPLQQADAFGGVIITEWYALPDTPDERYKLNVYILGRELRADGVRVSAFRQIKAGEGTWRDAPVAEDTAAKLENAILTRARQMRINTRAQTGN